MTIVLLSLAAGLAGYVASIFTWSRVRQAMVGVESEIEALRTKARELETKLRG
jgi:hypothetical protein